MTPAIDFFSRQPSHSEIIERLKEYKTWLEIDLDAIGHNLRVVRERTGVEVIPCIKKDAYGHGIVPITAYLTQKGVRSFLVAKLWEAEQIRKANLDCEVINLDPIFTEKQFHKIINMNISQVIYQKKSALMLSKVAKVTEKPAKTWVKVDTGLGRVGVQHDTAVDYIEFLSKLPGIKIEGIFTTLLEDENDIHQIQRIKNIKEKCKQKGINIGKLSAASSHGVFHLPESYLDAVRPGVMLFGFYPTHETREMNIELKPVLAMKARLEHVKMVEKGTPLTYGGVYVTPARMKVGTMHTGYSDGYPRQLSKKGLVNVNGEICPIIGGVSINHILVDLRGTKAETGDVVDAISREGDNSVHNLCDLAGIEPYQLAVWMNPLTPRVYFIDGKAVALSELFLSEK